MSVVNEQQTSLPPQPKGADLVITEHDFNPENGHYEPELYHAPDSVLGIAQSGGAIIFGVPLTVRARWVYGIIATDGGSGLETLIISDVTAGAQKVQAIINSGGNFVVMSDPEAPIFRVPGGDVLQLISVGGNPVVVDLIYIDK